LHKEYWDDDIGICSSDHIGDSKKYLSDLFVRIPTMGVDIISSLSDENIITAYLNWYSIIEGKKKILKKGVGIFVIKDYKIFKRHNYIYFDLNSDDKF
jgi:hypothetical protein